MSESRKSLENRRFWRFRFQTSVEEYTEGSNNDLRIKKVYQLSLADDPAGIPTEDFERDGCVYHLLDITQQNDVGVHTTEYTESITQDSATGDMAAVLKQLDAQREVTTDDGYTGVLILDHKSVEITVKGYNTSTKNLSASRTYPNLSDADLSLVPKTVNENGKTLTLSDVQWSSQYQEDGSLHYTASAKYTGTATSRYATGYTVTANYTGTVAKTNCEVITYTAIFGGKELPKEEVEQAVEPELEQEAAPEIVREDEPEIEPEAEETTEAAPERDRSALLSIFGCIGGVCALAAAGVWSAGKFKERKKTA